MDMDYATYIFQLVMLICLIMHKVHSNKTCYSQESCLYDDLMKNYNNQVRPATKPGETVDVKISVNLKNVLGLDEKNEVLHTVLSIAASWTDRYLHWSTNHYGGATAILVSVKNLWTPDFAVVNSADKIYDEISLKDFKALITSKGFITWLFGGIYKTSCAMDISRYPFDTQTCTLVIENWSYPEMFVNLTEGQFGTQSFSGNGIWDLTGHSTNRETYNIPTENGTSFPRITYSMQLKRKSGYYIFNIVLPSVFVLMAAMGVFWLPPGCGEKISLGITVLLAFSVFQIVITSSTPVNSDQTPLISKAMMSIMGLATLSLLTSMITVYLHHKGSSRRIPSWLRVIAFKYLAKLYCTKDEIPCGGHEMIVPVDSTPEIIHNDHTESTSPSLVKLGHVNKKMKHCEDPSKTELLSILNEVQQITEAIQEQKRDDSIMDEWKLLAKIVDRLLFTVAMIIICLLIIVICV